MNAERRLELKNALQMLNDATGIIDQIKEDEGIAHDNLPESLQDGDKGNAMQEAVDAMEEALSSIEDAVGRIEDAIGE